jgi:hypothetical protein
MRQLFGNTGKILVLDTTSDESVNLTNREADIAIRVVHDRNARSARFRAPKLIKLPSNVAGPSLQQAPHESVRDHDLRPELYAALRLEEGSLTVPRQIPD